MEIDPRPTTLHPSPSTRRGLRDRQADGGEQELHVFPNQPLAFLRLLFGAAVAGEQVRGMVGDDDRDSFVVMSLAPEFADGEACFQQVGGGGAAESADAAWE